MKAYDNGKRDISDQIVGYPEHWSKKKAFQVVEYIDEDEVERRGYKQFLGRPMTDLEWGARGYPEGHRRITVRRVFDKKAKPS